MVAVKPPKEFLSKILTTSSAEQGNRHSAAATLAAAAQKNQLLKRVAQLLDTTAQSRNYEQNHEVLFFKIRTIYLGPSQ